MYRYLNPFKQELENGKRIPSYLTKLEYAILPPERGDETKFQSTSMLTKMLHRSGGDGRNMCYGCSQVVEKI